MFSKKATPEGSLETDHLLAGLIGILIFQAIDFVADMIWLRTRPFAWIERLGQISLSRVIVIQLTIIGGMAAVMFTGANRHFFGIFIFLKTMLNLSIVTPQYKPKTPPALALERDGPYQTIERGRHLRRVLGKDRRAGRVPRRAE